MRALIFFSAFLLPWFWVSRAEASPKNSGSESPTKAAKKACAAGDYRKGVEILADLYVNTNAAVLIYNQGRCYEQNHQWLSAIDRFREYLRKSRDISPEDSADAEKHIADCQRFQAEEEAKTSPPPIANKVVMQPSPPPPPPPPPVEESTPVSVAATPVQSNSGSALRTTGIVVGSVGLAGLGAGVVLNVKANQLANSGNESGQKSYRNGALVCYGVGGAAVVTGVVLYLIGQHHAETTPAGIALLPIWAPGGATLTLAGEF